MHITDIHVNGSQPSHRWGYLHIQTRHGETVYTLPDQLDDMSEDLPRPVFDSIRAYFFACVSNGVAPVARPQPNGDFLKDEKITDDLRRICLARQPQQHIHK